METTKTSDGSSIAWYSTTSHSSNIESEVVSLIRRAKKAITVLTGTFSNKEILKALNQKAGEGINILLIHNENVSQKILRIGLDPRISLMCNKKELAEVMHRKIVIIDDEEVIWGSANLTDKLAQDRNLMTSVRSRPLAQHVVGEFLEGVRPKEANILLDDGREIKFFLTPDPWKARYVILNSIQGAEKSIKIAMFHFADEAIARSIVSRFKRIGTKKIKVRVILDRSDIHINESVYKILKDGGIRVSVNNSDDRDYYLMHHKFCLIDGKKLIHGSLNFTSSAFKRNLDCFSVIPELKTEDERYIKHIWRDLKQNINPSFVLQLPRLTQHSREVTFKEPDIRKLHQINRLIARENEKTEEAQSNLAILQEARSEVLKKIRDKCSVTQKE